MDVAVEDQADDVTLGVDERAAAVASDDVVVGGQVESGVEVEFVFGFRPARGDGEGGFACGAFVEAGERGEGFYRFAVFGPALYGAVAQAKGEGRVGVD